MTAGVGAQAWRHAFVAGVRFGAGLNEPFDLATRTARAARWLPLTDQSRAKATPKGQQCEAWVAAEGVRVGNINRSLIATICDQFETLRLALTAAKGNDDRDSVGLGLTTVPGKLQSAALLNQRTRSR